MAKYKQIYEDGIPKKFTKKRTKALSSLRNTARKHSKAGVLKLCSPVINLPTELSRDLYPPRTIKLEVNGQGSDLNTPESGSHRMEANQIPPELSLPEKQEPLLITPHNTIKSKKSRRRISQSVQMKPCVNNIAGEQRHLVED